MFTQQQVLPTDASKSKKIGLESDVFLEKKKKKFKNLVSPSHRVLYVL